MSSLSPFASLVSEDFSHELSVFNHCSEEQEHCWSFCCNMKELNIGASEELDNASASEEILVVAQSGLDFGKTVNAQDCQCDGHVPFSCSPPHQKDTTISNEITICQEPSQSVSLDTKTQKCLMKSKTFPLPKEKHAHPSSSSCEANSSGISIQNQDSAVNGSSAYARSKSLPASSTFISAMKGSRAQNGSATKLELRVKWASDVYDPPTTTVSHTVKAHNNQRSKSKKDKHKNKRKSSRGSGGERKHGNCKTLGKLPEPLKVSFQASGSRQNFGDEFGNKEVDDILEYSVDSQEAKCGSSFLREAMPKVHLPIGEAS